MAEKREGGGDPARLETLNKIYLTVISRYKDYIEERESLSVAELPVLVTPKNAVVVKKVEEIKSGFEPYRYESAFADAAKLAFDFVSRDIGEVVLPLQFWLTPEETLAFQMGDVFDRNVLLCSMLVGLGNPSSKVFVMINEDESRRIFVYYEFNNSVKLLDLGDGIKDFSSKGEMVASMGISDSTTAYEFNDRVYSDIA